MTDHANSTAREVHALLLESHPETHDVNLAKAAHLAEAAGDPNNRLQLETFVAIQHLQMAIEHSASAAESEELLLKAIRVAERWAIS